MRNIKYKVILLFVLIGLKGFAQEVPETNQSEVMPVPKEISFTGEKFRLTTDFSISLQGEFDERLYKGTDRFLRNLDKRTGLFFFQNKIDSKDIHDKAPFVLTSERKGELKVNEEEAYRLEVSASKIQLTATNDLGLLRGLETLLQTLKVDEKGYYFPGVVVTDSPRFTWRGLMIDVSRHFLPLEVIKRNIDGMAAVKLNVLHLHLTDDHGFRVESKVYPKLHEIGGDGKYFTQKEIREIVKYANDRGIRVVPEFDVPGHATAILAAYPELASHKEQYIQPFLQDLFKHRMTEDGSYRLADRSGIFDATLDPTKEETYVFLEALFTEMAGLFPDEYFHIGGDENEAHQWDENEDIVAFKEKHGYDNHQLQGYFNRRLLEFITPLGKQMMGWDEILQPDLPTKAVIQSWRGQESLYKAAEKGYQVVLSNGYYIDLMRSVDHHYSIDPLGNKPETLSEAAKEKVLGGEATLWSELVTPQTVDSRIWPRMAAIAERYWSAEALLDPNTIHERLEVVSRRLEEVGLTHMTNREALLRNLANGYEVEPLRTLVDVCEPMKGYTRNKNGALYEFHFAFTKFADVTIADAPAARKFNKLVDQYLATGEGAEDVKSTLSTWATNHAALQQLIVNSPILKEIEALSANFSKTSQRVLEVLNSEEKISYEDYQALRASLEEARKEGGRTELQVVDAFDKLLKSKVAYISASKTTKRVRVDGNLKEWANSSWDYFVNRHAYGQDSCKFALQWDSKYLYLAFEVEDTDLQAEKKQRDEEGLHLDDGIEFLLDPNFERSAEWQADDIAYHVNAANIIYDEKGNKDGVFNKSWNGKARTAVKLQGTLNNMNDTDKGYTVEVAIPWTEIGTQPSKDLQIGINVCINDSNKDTKAYEYYDYMYLNVFHTPSGFAELKLFE
ncbi:family 20 glycosylhydrolase [Sediminitomix flava]|uniref:Hexosaminidase n=1 Tax=Sediminitomix flava TaxID=379075 RepID=A0A315ZCJ7_SEDFL|nr:family 20 glycosylhydrolase [Sediminitomix flava]PWJ43261.1 hexosaminidase [Sediminitomix flava]